MSLRFCLYATPDSITDEQIAILDKLDKLTFPSDELYPKRGRWWWVVKDKGNVVAFAGLSVLKGCNDGSGYLCRVGVLKKYRRRGIQNRFIKLRIKKAKELRLRDIISAVAVGNETSANQLIKHKFQLFNPHSPWLAIKAYYFIRHIC